MDGDLSALIGSRLCHDLVSPLGAIGNGLELLHMTQPPSQELELVGQAVKVAQARLRLFRLAFGQAQAEQQVSASEMALALAALQGNGRIAVVVSVPPHVPRPHARRLALAALCAESALAWGGDIQVTVQGVAAHAERLKRDDDAWQALIDGTHPRATTSALVHFALLAASGPVTVTQSETDLTITL